MPLVVTSLGSALAVGSGEIVEGRSDMRVFMLGWEFPPFISGGLGTACYGLTRGLDRLGVGVLFVLPRPVDPSHSSHVQIISPGRPSPAMERRRAGRRYSSREFRNVQFET